MGPSIYFCMCMHVCVLFGYYMLYNIYWYINYIYMKNFVAKINRNVINKKHFTNSRLSWQVWPRAWFQGSVGNTWVKTHETIFFLIAEMNVQDKNSNSFVNIFAIMAGVYLLAYLSTCLFAKYFLSVYYE